MFNGAAASDPMPLGVAIGLGVLLIATGALLIAVAVRSRRGNLPRNWIVGVRTRTTLSSDEAWRVGHQAAAPSLAIGASVPLVAGVALLFRPSNGLGLAITSVGLVWILAWVLKAGYVGNRAAQRRDAGPPT